MSVALFVDVHVPAAISRGLSRRGVDVLTAQDDGAARLKDPELISKASTPDGCRGQIVHLPL